MNPEAMRPHGRALLDYHRGDLSATVTIIRDDGRIDLLPAGGFFRDAESFEVERIALALCRGQILDAGAGAGIHTLFLRNKGFNVTAIDVVPEAVLVMKERGISDAQQADIMTFDLSEFDTILMMGHGIGMVENIAGLDQFLEHADLLRGPNAQILLTSLDVRTWKSPESEAFINHNLALGRYPGEIRMQFKYKELTGPLCGWLHVDPATLAEHSSRYAWSCELVKGQEDGNYLARMVRKAH